MQRLFAKYDLCITGKALEKFYNSPFYIHILLPRIFVYARASPVQKEYVLASMKRAGYTTLMCGDGTNDVGALKQAHVGVALLDGTKEDLEKIAIAFRERRLREMREKQEEMLKAWGVKTPEDARRTQQQRRQVNKLMESMQDMDDVPILKFGDASVAAPFTSKLGSVSASMCRDHC
jgi:cation-transporting ATPase 13A1